MKRWIEFVFYKKFVIFLKKIMSKVKISTEKGDMIAELYENETPITVKNFLDLTTKGFYNGLNFHRVIPGFVAQGGCPNGVGNGGPGYTIPCEVSAPKQYHDKGVLSMAHAGRNTGGSQFFICHNRQGTQHLDGNHTCFGKVIEGMDVIPNISQGTKIHSIELV
jgi:peptidyl-prolyl cis-trans isomerase B (cyclophilin B)